MTEHALERAGAGVTASRHAWSGLAWRQYRLERRMFWRNPTAAFFNFMFPLILLGLFGAILSGNHKQLSIIVPGIASMSVMSTTFTALAFNLTFLREQGILKRMRGTPLPSSAYFAGIAGGAVTNTALQMVIITVSGRVLFGLDWPDDLLAMAVFVALGVVCFASLGVALSHAIPNFESAPAYVNAIFLPMIFISGVFFDAAGRAHVHQGRRRGAPAQAPDRRPVGRDGATRGPRRPRRRAARAGRLGRGRRAAGRARLLLGGQERPPPPRAPLLDP